MTDADYDTPPTDDDDAYYCENCDGTGLVGDGKLEMDCPECGGTGIEC